MSHLLEPKRRRKATLGIRCRVSVFGGYRLACKRNTGNSSAMSLSAHLDINLKIDAVVNWEKRLGDAVIIALRSWYAEHYLRLAITHKAIETNNLVIQDSSAHLHPPTFVGGCNTQHAP